MPSPSEPSSIQRVLHVCLHFEKDSLMSYPGPSPHFFEGLLPRPLPDGFPDLLGPFGGLLAFFAILSPPL